MKELSENAQKTWVLALTSVASLMVALDALVVTTALGTIRLDLGASIEALQWTMNAYNLSFAVLLQSRSPYSPATEALARRRPSAPGSLRRSASPRSCRCWEQSPGCGNPPGDQPFWRKSGQAPEADRAAQGSTHVARTNRVSR